MLEVYNNSPRSEEHSGTERYSTNHLEWFATEIIQKSVLGFRKHLQACVKADGGNFEHLLH